MSHVAISSARGRRHSGRAQPSGRPAEPAVHDGREGRGHRVGDPGELQGCERGSAVRPYEDLADVGSGRVVDVCVYGHERLRQRRMLARFQDLPFSRSRPQGGGTAPIDQRAVFTAIVYVLISGCAWRSQCMPGADMITSIPARQHRPHLVRGGPSITCPAPVARPSVAAAPCQGRRHGRGRGAAPSRPLMARPHPGPLPTPPHRTSPPSGPAPSQPFGGIGQAARGFRRRTCRPVLAFDAVPKVLDKVDRLETVPEGTGPVGGSPPTGTLQRSQLRFCIGVAPAELSVHAVPVQMT